MTLRAVPRVKPALWDTSVDQQAFLNAVQRNALLLDQARDELWDGLATSDIDLVVSASRRLLALSLVLRDETQKLYPPKGGAA